jgi:uncharacterized lipoprotein YehR (DUF1307 family)
MKKIAIAIVIASLSACTDNQRTKMFGGTMEIEVPKGTKVINATWKETELWYLTRPMTSADSAQEVIFREKSGYGVSEGKVIFKESK